MILDNSFTGIHLCRFDFFRNARSKAQSPGFFIPSLVMLFLS